MFSQRFVRLSLHLKPQNHILRCLSQQTQIKSNTDVVRKEEPSKEAMIPKDAEDNFLITFHDRKPTYDQLFEYKIGDEEFNKTKFTDESFLSADKKIMLSYKYDISFAGFQRWLKRRYHQIEVRNQIYRNRRHAILGPDLASSHFILARGGKARFAHQPDVWITNDKSLPKSFDKKYELISLDASNTGLIYEGLDNFILLTHIEELNLSRNIKLDDWACDKLARIFRNSKSLEYLDLSDMPLVTHRGIEVMYKIRSLKTLVISGTRAAQFPFIELLNLMLKDVNPDCEIIYK